MFIAFEKIKRHLQDVYGASDEQARVALYSTALKKLSEEISIPTINTLRDEDIPLDQILRNPWILLCSRNKLLPRFYRLRSGDHMFCATSHCLPFCSFSMAHINKYWAFLKHEKLQLPPQYPNKIYYIADQLQIDVPMLSESMARPRHVLLAPFSRVKEIVDLCSHYAVPKEHILRDPYVFLYSVESSKKRMDVMYGKYKAVNERKLWITYCSEKKFFASVRSHLDRKEQEKLLLPHNGSLAGFMAHKLGMSEDVVQARMQTQFWSSPKPSKVSDVIDLLWAQGFTSEQIMKTMTVFQYSLKRLRERVDVLSELGVRGYSIRLLSCPQNQFKRFCLKETSKRAKLSAPAEPACAPLAPQASSPLGGGEGVRSRGGGDDVTPLDSDGVRFRSAGDSANSHSGGDGVRFCGCGDDVTPLDSDGDSVNSRGGGGGGGGDVTPLDSDGDSVKSRGGADGVRPLGENILGSFREWTSSNNVRYALQPPESPAT